MATTINKSALGDAIIEFEKQSYYRDFITKLCDAPLVLCFKGRRTERLCVLSTSIWPKVDIESNLNVVNAIVKSRNDVSDSIDYFSMATIDSVQSNELKQIAMSKYEFSLDIYDKSRMSSIDTFKTALGIDNDSLDENDEISVIEKALYDYLASSDDSSYLKNSLYYSLILLRLYNSKDGLSLAQLDSFLSEKFNRKVEKLDTVIRFLRKEGHISPQSSGSAYITLTQAERDRIYDSIQRSKAAEQQFNESFEKIIEKFNIVNKQELFEKLRDIIVAECNTISDDNSDSEDGSIDLEKYIDDIKAFVAKEKQEAFFKSLKDLLFDSNYLSTFCLGEKFLELYRSDRYEQYINNKKNIVVLDTMVLIYMICSKHKYNSKIDFEWEDLDYQRVRDLYNYRDENKCSVLFETGLDYIDEVIGEIKKSIQLTWFANIDLPIPFTTSNIFYNHYLYLKNSLRAYDEAIPSYEDYLKGIGLSVLDVDSIYFKREATNTLMAYLKVFNIDYISRHPRYEGFDDVKLKYLDFISRKKKHKSDSAVNADIRMAFYLAEKYIHEEESDNVYYMTSWDKTLMELRRHANEQLKLSRSYEIRTPGELLQLLSLKSFHISKSSIGKELFTFADETFGFKSKASSLFDNILNPYFASKNNSNTELVTLLLKLESTRINEEVSMEESSRAKKRTFLEEFFIMIIERLSKNSCGTSELRSYLSDPENNQAIVDVFKSAYEAEDYLQQDLLAYSFVDNLKDYLIEKDNAVDEHESELEA